MFDKVCYLAGAIALLNVVALLINISSPMLQFWGTLAPNVLSFHMVAFIVLFVVLMVLGAIREEKEKL